MFMSMKSTLFGFQSRLSRLKQALSNVAPSQDKQFPRRCSIRTHWQKQRPQTHGYSAAAGFYHVKDQCADRPLRVYCPAVDNRSNESGIYFQRSETYSSFRGPQDVVNACRQVRQLPKGLQDEETILLLQELISAHGFCDSVDPEAKEPFVALAFSVELSGQIFHDFAKADVSQILRAFLKLSPTSPLSTREIFGYGCSSGWTFEDWINVNPIAIACQEEAVPALEDTIRLSCETSLDSFLQDEPSLRVGDQITIRCPQDCPLKGHLIGNNSQGYRDDSLICLAAMHSQVLNSLGHDPEDDAMAYVQIINGTTTYNAVESTGISSMGFSNSKPWPR
eukprot:Gregarina_sp_Poly_1__10394@NODE_746_length_6478_cov_51_732491_g556_i0_p3_GENE_NODE_746_length_6478_cov_51_732491_g556_i0NODE_746_length_6478_cov_51_732491_g556_i0_p3_ORF_typecomplete_len336_score34_29LCCL/PF03815_19/2_8e03LCCL/PF03815_19/8_3e14DUF1392/PF07154_11/0_03_NODE_746_length_6478_cov_51_732491_g556_i050656072